MIWQLSVEENEKRWLILRNKVYQEKIKSAFKLFRENGIEPILIKGWAAAIEYPDASLRVFSDLDLSVAAADYPKSRKLIATEEKAAAMNIDLHEGLRHLDTRSWEELFDNSILCDLDDMKVRVLKPEDHLRVLCVHWLNDGGADRKRLLDIYYLLKNHAADFDWEKCFAGISEIRKDWIIKTISIVGGEYDLDGFELPFEADIDLLPEWMVKTVRSEWSSNIKLLPLHTLLGKPLEFWKQLKKRLPPNPIQATIDMEGRFDNAPRVYYQIGSIFLRLKPSLQRIADALKIAFKTKKV